MPEETNANAPIDASGGQAGQAQTEPAPAEAQGQAGDSTTGKGQAKAPETEIERFLTLDDVPEDVRDHVSGILSKKEKEMQAAFTRKTQAIARDRQKLELVNQFEQNPIETLTKVAQQYGFQLNRAGQEQMKQQVQPQQYGEDWQPNTWEDVLKVAEDRAEQRILTKLQPYLQPMMQTVEKIKSDSIEQSLDKIDPGWRMYEDEIKESMKLAPNLIQSPTGIAKLYRMSVPEDVLTSRATQAALQKFETKAKSAQVESKSHATKTTQETKVESFNDAVLAAKRQLGMI